MPTYEYSCPKCGDFEEFHSINTKLTHCPKCGQEVTRLISRNQNIIFKGSGFHNTDNRSDDYQKKAASENPGSSTSSSETKENKPATSETKENKPASSETKENKPATSQTKENKPASTESKATKENKPASTESKAS